jgi:hypothetical protein
MPVDFVSEAIGFGPGHIAEWTGLSRRTAVYACAILLCALTAYAVPIMRGLRMQDPLVLAAPCAVLGRLCFYHRPNDQVMLFPLLLACLVIATQERGRAAAAVAVAVSLTLWLPLGIQFALPFGPVLQPLIWVAGTLCVAVQGYRTRSATPTSFCP